MPEHVNGKTVFTLLEFSESIQRMFTQHFSGSYWIKAEMHKLGYYAQSGHCFPELVEKREGKIIAKMDGLIWKKDYHLINANFKKVLNDELKDGIKVLLLARAEYSTEYGLKLNIHDIDPGYTLGDFERERQETIRRLQEEKLFDKNKLLAFPALPQRIAVISDSDSRGYQDFIAVLDAAKKEWGYAFFHMLFKASLQGEKALVSIPEQLDKILRVKNHFDLVAILRGGGGELTFACYNNYELSKKVATFPLPVVTGIGHVTNQTVVDMVARQSSITPTKLAEYLVQKFHNFSVPVNKAQENIVDHSRWLLDDAKKGFETQVKLFRSGVSRMLIENKSRLRENAGNLVRQTKFTFRNQRESLEGSRREIGKEVKLLLLNGRQQLDLSRLAITKWVKSGFVSARQQLTHAEKEIKHLSPENVLKRGFSITLFNGKSLKTAGRLEPGDTVETLLYEGSINSTVNSTTKKSKT